MTKHEREVAIANNHRYLNLLMDQTLEKFAQVPRIHVLGFSQGAATSTRWASQWSGKIDTLVLWAGGFAQDLSLDLGREKFEQTELILAFGDQDELIQEEHKKQQLELIQALGKQPNVVNFAGGHELDADLLQKIMNREF